MRDQMADPCSSLHRKVKLYMCILVPRKPLQHMLTRCPKHVMDLMDLIQFILPWKQWEQTQDLKEHTAHSPDIHLIIIIPLCKKTLR
jgi:hypothetical protein